MHDFGGTFVVLMVTSPTQPNRFVQVDFVDPVHVIYYVMVWLNLLLPWSLVVLNRCFLPLLH